MLYQFCLSKACSEATIFGFVCSWNIQSMLFRSRSSTFNVSWVDCTCSAPRVFSTKQIQLKVLLVLPKIQVAPCTNYIKPVLVWFSGYTSLLRDFMTCLADSGACRANGITLPLPQAIPAERWDTATPNAATTG